MAVESGPAVAAFLEGGPATLPVELRHQQVSPDDECIKIEHWGGREHFVRRSEQNSGATLIFFDWVTRTRIAE